MSAIHKLTAVRFDEAGIPSEGVSAEERRELYRMSDAINAEIDAERTSAQRGEIDYSVHTEPRNEREAHSRMCSACESGLTGCATPQACERAEKWHGARREFRGYWWLMLFAVALGLAGSSFGWWQP